jgi:hypothetical protein
MGSDMGPAAWALVAYARLTSASRAVAGAGAGADEDGDGDEDVNIDVVTILQVGVQG